MHQLNPFADVLRFVVHAPYPTRDVGHLPLNSIRANAMGDDILMQKRRSRMPKPVRRLPIFIPHTLKRSVHRHVAHNLTRIH